MNLFYKTLIGSIGYVLITLSFYNIGKHKGYLDGCSDSTIKVAQGLKEQGLIVIVSSKLKEMCQKDWEGK